MKTAVEWLFERLERMIPRTKLYDIDKKQYLEQAKAMEKEQIKDAWLSGQYDGATICTPNQHYLDEDYYNETYGK